MVIICRKAGVLLTVSLAYCGGPEPLAEQRSQRPNRILTGSV